MSLTAIEVEAIKVSLSQPPPSIPASAKIIIFSQLSLKSHNDSFDELLRYIPAKMYIREEDEEKVVPVS